MIETLLVNFYVNGEFATAYDFRNTAEGIDIFFYIFSNNSKIIPLGNKPDIVPSVGMNYDGEQFIDGDNGETFENVNPEMLTRDVEIFAFVVDGKVYYVYPVITLDQKLIAIFSSDPTFQIVEEVINENPMGSL